MDTSEASEVVICLLIDQDRPQKKSRHNTQYSSVLQDPILYTLSSPSASHLKTHAKMR